MKSISQTEAADLAKLHSGSPWVEILDIECPDGFDQAGVPESAFCSDGARVHILLSSSSEGLFIPMAGWTSWPLEGGMYANAVPFQRDDIRDTTDSYGRVQTAVTLGDSKGFLASFLDANSGCCGWKVTVYAVMVADLTLHTVTKGNVTYVYQEATPPDMGYPFVVTGAATDGQGVTVNLSSGSELDRKYPPRIMLKNYCQLRYGSAECGASGLFVEREYQQCSGTGFHDLDFITPNGLVRCGNRLSVIDLATGDVLKTVAADVVWAEETPSAGQGGTVAAWFAYRDASHPSRLHPGLLVIEDGVYNSYGDTGINLTANYSDAADPAILADRLRRSFSATDSALYCIDFWTATAGVYKSNILKAYAISGDHGIAAVASLGFLDDAYCCQVSMQQRWAGCGIFTTEAGRSARLYGSALAFTGCENLQSGEWYYLDGGYTALAVALRREADSPEDDPDRFSPIEVPCLFLNDRGIYSQGVPGPGQGYFFKDAPKEPEYNDPTVLEYDGAPLDFSDVWTGEGVFIEREDFLGGARVFNLALAGGLMRCAYNFLAPSVTYIELPVNMQIGHDSVTSRFQLFDTAAQTLYDWNEWDDDPAVFANCGDLTAFHVMFRDFLTYRPLKAYAIRDGRLQLVTDSAASPCGHSLADCRRRCNRARFGGFAGIGNGGLLE